MDFLPVFLNVRAQECLLVGGGDVALRKASLLHKAGARLRLVAPGVSTELKNLLESNGGSLLLRGFEQKDMEGVRLVIAATNDEQLNARISRLAQAANIPVNVVDQPALCSFIVPAIVDRSPVVIAVSSGGNSPILTRDIKARIEVAIPAASGRLASMLGGYREKVKQRISSFTARARFWEKLLAGPFAELVYAGRENDAADCFEQLLSDPDNERVQGEVFLVGAGPGDPDLLTIKALRLMYAADVVLYDRLVSAEILEKIRPDAEKIHVGKARARHTLPQQQINDLLVDLAKQGKKVLRLKGGDPFIFGRGGEEIDRLASEKIPFQVIPGITAASGCACYAGIPLTHRDFSQSVRFVTGHLQDGSVDLDWAQLTGEQQTVVFYMGLLGLEEICRQLIAHGMPSDMPVALIQQGTTSRQKVLTGTLASMPAIVQAAEVQAPTLIIVGRVVSLHRQLSWFA
ncbi:MAG: siroheme synthase CysG [Pseudomonadales bacterium]|nr:siroheme synthase CysG [Pseudomonadales bacterium]